MYYVDGGGSPDQRSLSRRRFLQAGLLGGALLAIDACTPQARQRPVPPAAGYGPLGPADANGIASPAGFHARPIAREGDLVAGSAYRWHAAPDGGRTFATPDGWVYVSNSEIDRTGGVGMIRFDQGGAIIGAGRLLDNTSRNCSGGHTPWGTWLSCEEITRGRVFEVHPLGLQTPKTYPAMGRFQHEGAAVDASRQTVYLTEDEQFGLFYRYRYDRPNDLSTGVLEAAQVVNGVATWLRVPDPAAAQQPTRLQVAGGTTFGGAEGVWYANDVVNFTTKLDDKVWAYNVVTQQLGVVYDWRTNPNPILRGVDNLAVRNGVLFVCEDQSGIGFPDDPEVCLVAASGQVSTFLRVYGQRTSELTGIAFNPRGDRLYVSSQRGSDGRGITYEISGPF
jgi:secreted PhoX family phosphatase